MSALITELPDLTGFIPFLNLFLIVDTILMTQIAMSNIEGKNELIGSFSFEQIFFLAFIE